MGILPATLVACHMGPTVLFKVYAIALNMMKTKKEPQEIIFYCDAQSSEKMNFSHGPDCLTFHFKQITAILAFIATATGSG